MKSPKTTSKTNAVCKPFKVPANVKVDTAKIYGLPAANIIKQPMKTKHK